MYDLINLIILSRARGWLIAVAVALIIGAGVVTPVAAQESDLATLTIVAPALNVRTGPGTTYDATTVATQDQQFTILSYDATNNWWQIQLPDQTTGWVSGNAAYVSVSQTAINQFNNTQTQELSNLQSPVSSLQSPISDPQSPVSNLQSPSTLVFQTATGGDIYAINSDGSNLRYLASGLDPAISPDGQQVAFARWETSQDGSLGSVSVVNIDGTGERVIHENIFNPRTPVWSPDGSQVAISKQHGGRPQPEQICGDLRPPREAYDIETTQDGRRVIKYCYTLPPDPHWGLSIIDVTTGQIEDLTHDIYSFSPAWDPNNSSHLIYDGDFGLVSLDLNEERTWPLTEDFNDRSPVYSPDGSQIAISYRQDDHWEVHVMNADGSERTRLTETSYLTLVQQQLDGQDPHSFNNASPTWSPDGSQIAFLTDRTGAWEIWVMNADGSDQRPMFPAGTLADLTLQYNGMDEQALSWR